MTVQEVATQLNMSKQQVLDAIHLGHLRAVKLGRAYTLTPEAVAQFVANRPQLAPRRARVPQAAPTSGALTVQQTAGQLGVTPAVVRRAIRAGTLPATRHNGQYWIAPDALTRWHTFWKHVRVVGDHWLWQRKSRDKRGYLYQHRPITQLAWESHYGPVPAKHTVQNACGVENCIRPDHLALQWSKAGHRRFTREQVAAIRGKYQPHKYTMMQLAQEYDTTINTINSIINGNTYPLTPDELIAAYQAGLKPLAETGTAC
jgi:excisionase family DNA binding protein